MLENTTRNNIRKKYTSGVGSLHLLTSITRFGKIWACSWSKRTCHILGSLIPPSDHGSMTSKEYTVGFGVDLDRRSQRPAVYLTALTLTIHLDLVLNMSTVPPGGVLVYFTPIVAAVGRLSLFPSGFRASVCWCCAMFAETLGIPSPVVSTGVDRCGLFPVKARLAHVTPCSETHALLRELCALVWLACPRSLLNAGAYVLVTNCLKDHQAGVTTFPSSLSPVLLLVCSHSLPFSVPPTTLGYRGNIFSSHLTRLHGRTRLQETRALGRKPGTTCAIKR
jgi:hypothetical protein